MISKSCVARSEKDVPPLSWTTRTPWRGARVRWAATRTHRAPPGDADAHAVAHELGHHIRTDATDLLDGLGLGPRAPWATRTHARPKRFSRRRASLRGFLARIVDLDGHEAALAAVGEEFGDRGARHAHAGGDLGLAQALLVVELDRLDRLLRRACPRFLLPVRSRRTAVRTPSPGRRCAARGSTPSAISMAPERDSRARSMRHSSSVWSVSSGWPAATRLARLGVDLDAGARLHRVLLDGATRAQPPRGHAHGQGVHADDGSLGLGEDLVGVRGARQRRVGVAALLADHRAPAVHRAPVRQRGLHVGVAHPREVEHVARELARSARRRRTGPPPARTSTDSSTSRALPILRPSGTDMSVSRARVATPASRAEVHHRAGELARGVQVLHEGTRADLDVQDEGSRALGDLLAHDRASDQRDRLDGRGDVAQGVELLVRGGQARAGRADDRAAAGRPAES